MNGMNAEELNPNISTMIHTQTQNGVTAFYTKKSPLSNFFRCEFVCHGKRFHSSEQCYQYSKALFFNDVKTASQILESGSPFKCLLLGRQVQNFDKNVWRSGVAIQCMRIALRAKFEKNFHLQKVLNETGDSLICEASKNDRYWGVGYTFSEPNLFQPKCWLGYNHMGKLLMELRKEFK